ncbi:hypothetical protein ECHLIB_0987 [Ehrlichia chaffeensis str. Liberty]|nr:hypothetical protein ECHJAX_0986 [Ehrlichia chaffeensis str. Jax]AHX07020.1 hypothetical protein ECHLIB_0987 [Ehrlichia chaffeensis str. Liberty]AHX07758.1 hypothetical protein ECHOSC_0980 [Ehrlichia chaffeensis str. Osceola]
MQTGEVKIPPLSGCIESAEVLKVADLVVGAATLIKFL